MHVRPIVSGPGFPAGAGVSLTALGKNSAGRSSKSPFMTGGLPDIRRLAPETIIAPGYGRQANNVDPAGPADGGGGAGAFPLFLPGGRNPAGGPARQKGLHPEAIFFILYN